jgi:DNA-directed RNA polymerase specialized sigma24 family protein
MDGGAHAAKRIDPALLHALAHDWVPLLPRLLELARKRTKSAARASDFVQDAYIVLAEGDRTWDREKQPDFAAFALGVVSSLIADAPRYAHARRELRFKTADGDEHVPDANADPERAADARELDEAFEAVRVAVRASFEEGDLAVKLLDLPGDEGDVERVDVLAERFCVRSSEVLKARARIRYARNTIARDRAVLFLKGGAAVERRVDAEELGLLVGEALTLTDADARARLEGAGVDVDAELAVHRAWAEELVQQHGAWAEERAAAEREAWSRELAQREARAQAAKKGGQKTGIVVVVVTVIVIVAALVVENWPR